MTPDPTTTIVERRTLDDVAVSDAPRGASDASPATTSDVLVDGASDAQLVHPELQAPAPSMVLRLPTHLVPMPGCVLDVEGLEDWIIGAYLVAWMRLNKTSPTLTDLSRISGRGTKRVHAALRRMMARRWLRGVKVKNEFAPGQFGLRWKYWLIEGSPLKQLVDGGDGFKWIGVPHAVCSSGSVLAVGVYLIAHEQRRIDGAIVTTPTDIARLLHCHRNTAARLLTAIGAIAVEPVRPGRAVYDLAIPYPLKHAGSVQVGPYTVPVHGPIDARLNRLQSLEGALAGAGLDPDTVLRETCGELLLRLGYVRLDLLMRVVEERHYRELVVASEPYRLSMVMRLGHRMRGGLRRITRQARELHETPPDTPSASEQLRVAVRSALAQVCVACSDTRIVDVGDGVFGPCPHCRT